ncbi:hypothetical protein PoB_003103700 [Plakobranchus ocellatus]|uniref:Uncharacterized protein n=1 Tax=Plakobranchus ocellatus TaxID=259542 RepID=A0AAV4ABX1_9GAST|nr:hypothetical protein PoB_003103700 [Plakobranchus ocellatus]
MSKYNTGLCGFSFGTFPSLQADINSSHQESMVNMRSFTVYTLLLSLLHKNCCDGQRPNLPISTKDLTSGGLKIKTSAFSKLSPCQNPGSLLKKCVTLSSRYSLASRSLLHCTNYSAAVHDWFLFNGKAKGNNCCVVKNLSAEEGLSSCNSNPSTPASGQHAPDGAEWTLYQRLNKSCVPNDQRLHSPPAETRPKESQDSDEGGSGGSSGKRLKKSRKSKIAVSG